MTARNRIGACVMLFSALASMPAAARDRAHVYHGGVRAACGKEINSQCSGVPDANGQLLACLYRHQTRAVLSSSRLIDQTLKLLL